MRNERTSIWKVVRALNNPESDGGFWLPNIQRPFVWSEDQIAKLFDSIMRQYPISTLLVWKAKAEIKHRKFIDHWRETQKVSDAFVMTNTDVKCLVLDGQQRLQSLIIGLRGSYNGRELHFDVMSGKLVSPEDIRFRFKFLDSGAASWPWVRLSDLVKQLSKASRLPQDVAETIVAKGGVTLSSDDLREVQRNIGRVQMEFLSDENISYQLLDSVDDPDAYSTEDVVEIFIRANSGGTKLGKSDLLFSLLASDWSNSDEETEELLEELNKTGYAFDRDFVLKACLVMLDKGAKYEVSKFRDPAVRKDLIAKWPDLSNAIKAVRDFLHGRTFLKSDKAVPSYMGLIPLIYFRYKFPMAWDAAEGREEYILRTMLTGAFSGTPDNLVDRCTKSINESRCFNKDQLFAVIREDNRSLEVSADTILGARYGKTLSHLIFNLWYRNFDYEPALEDNLPQQDHLFAQSLLKEVKIKSDDTGRVRQKYSIDERDQIANLALLTAKENGFQGKSGAPLDEWLPGRVAKDPSFLTTHLIPDQPELWKIEKYGEFIAARKELILKTFAPYIQIERSSTGASPPSALP